MGNTGLKIGSKWYLIERVHSLQYCISLMEIEPHHASKTVHDPNGRRSFLRRYHQIGGLGVAVIFQSI